MRKYGNKYRLLFLQKTLKILKINQATSLKILDNAYFLKKNCFILVEVVFFHSKTIMFYHTYILL